MELPGLGLLLDPAAVGGVIDAAAALRPDLSIVVRDAAGGVVAERGSGATADGVRRSIVVGERTVGEVVISANGTVEELGPIAELVARALALAAGEAEAQRGMAARRRLDEELAIGRRIQRSLMPRRYPSFAGWEVAAAYEAAREVGGDFYDAFELRDQPASLAFVIADVTGKGIPAAILMADARALIHASADHGSDPAEALARVNRILIGERATSLFVTAALGILDGPTGRLTLASAGHDPVHVIRADGSLTVLEPAGRLLGMTAELNARTCEATIEPGEAIVAHTDGITEARSPDGGFYGEDRYRSLLAGMAGRSAAEVVDAVVTDVAAFRAGAEPADDLTLLVLRRLPLVGPDDVGRDPSAGPFSPLRSDPG